MRRGSITNHLESLRGYRTPAERGRGIGKDLDALRADIERRQKALGGIGEAWSATVPPTMAAAAELKGVTRGVLSVRVRDAAARHTLDRFLRSGGLDALIRACPVTLTSVKFVR